MSENNIAILSEKNTQLIYDASLLVPADANFLEQSILDQAEHAEPVASGGRGKAWFVELADQYTVLRAYQRGGLMAKINQQTYAGWSAEQSRSFREWRLLHQLFNQGLPVPQPVAASCRRWPLRFSPFYRARILLRRIPEVQTLDQVLQQQALSEADWQKVGACIAAFHRQGVYHDDLNASNILLNQQMQVYLIDFDKGELREVSDQSLWPQKNLQRLQRSLLKQQSLHSTYHFSNTCWQALLDAYQSNTVQAG